VDAHWLRRHFPRLNESSARRRIRCKYVGFPRIRTPFRSSLKKNQSENFRASYRPTHYRRLVDTARRAAPELSLIERFY
jgi:hypothetical protein